MEGMELYFPRYTRAEERFNMISHIVGGGLGFVALLACVIVAAYNRNFWGVVGGIIYGFSVILLFTMSSIYHGLHISLAKKVFRTLDHCTIFILIAGTYTPILLSRFREAYPVYAWTIFGVVWGLAVLGVVLNAISVKRFAVFSLICHLSMGWMVVLSIRPLLYVLGQAFFVMLLLGGLMYTAGVVFYILGRRKKFMHSVFHLFVVVASVLHSIGIAAFVMP